MYESHNNLLSEQRAAESLNLSVASLRRYRQQGGGPVYVQLSPGRVAYDPADLKAWRAARKASNTAEGAKLGGRRRTPRDNAA
jgi:hypothetical protein